MVSAQLLVSGARKRFGSMVALDGVDLRLHGGIVTVLGPNGSGKTTLLRVLATVTRPDQGEVLVDGLDVRHESDRIEVRRRLGYLPQEPGFHRRARVFDVVDYVSILRGSTDERRRRSGVFEVLDRVGLADRAPDHASRLSS